MNFELTDEQHDLRRAIRSVLAEECPPTLARAANEGDVRADDLWLTMVELDWPALSLPVQLGGLGMTWVDQAVLLDELGRALAPVPYWATVTQFVPALLELGTVVQQERFVVPTVAGSSTGALAIDEGAGTWSLDGVRAEAVAQGDELVLSGIKRWVADGASATEIAVAVRLEGQLRVVVVPGASVSVTPLPPLDGTTRHADIGLDGVRLARDRLLGEGDAGRGLSRAIEAATLGVAVSMCGTCARILEMTRDYALAREQFGVPIGSFQAVKHKLADLHLDVQRATALGYFAALCVAEDDPRRTIAISMAKAAAGDAQRRAFQDGLQLHGGIGYSWEQDLHLFLRRAKVGDLQFGGASHHRRAVARAAMAGAVGAHK